MNDHQFKRTMQSIGLSCFVKHYELFADMQLSSGDAASLLSEREDYTVHACRSRVSHSRRIIESGRASDGLRMFLSSKVRDYHLERKARALLDRLHIKRSESDQKRRRLWGHSVGKIPIRKPEDVRGLLKSANLWSTMKSAYQIARTWVGADTLPSGIPTSVASILERAPEWAEVAAVSAVFEHATALDTKRGPSMSDVMVVCELVDGLGVVCVEGKAGEDFDYRVRDWLADATAKSGKPARLTWACEMLELERAGCDELRWQLFHRTASGILQAKRVGARHAVILVHDFTADVGNDHFADFEAFGAYVGFTGIARNAITPALELGGVSLRLAWVSEAPQR